MKHQGQTMSETMSMASLGLVFKRWSFLVVVTVLAADCELHDVDIITS